MPLLDLQRCTVAFGGLVALDDVSLHVDRDEVVGLIGPNGAGKTTVLNLITGVCTPATSQPAFPTANGEGAGNKRLRRLPVDYGDVQFLGRSLRKVPAHVVASRRIARTFQNIRLFANLTVQDNVRVGCHLHSAASVCGAVFRSRSYQADERAVTMRVTHLLHVLELGDYREELAGSLPYGQQRRLEIARALAVQPKLLLLDEPAAGMNPRETRELMDLILRVREESHLAVLLIEHDMRVVMGICQRVYCLDYGRVIAEGPPDKVRTDPLVVAAYLGED